MRPKNMRVLAASIAAVVGAVTAMAARAEAYGEDLVCENTLDDSFFNRCRRELPPGPFAALGETVATFVSPMTIFVSALALLFALPAMLVVHADVRKGGLAEALARHQRLYLGVLNFAHRAVYTLTLNVALYAVFRQHRPCRCGPPGGPLEQVGSIYGMPSGDAMSGGIVAGMLFSWEPLRSRRLAWAGGVAVMVLKCTERLALGFHSLGQVLTGTSLGLALSVYSERAPQFMVVVDSAVQVLLGLAFAVHHSAMDVGANSPVNIFTWWLWGAGANVLVAALLVRFYSRREYRGFRDDLRTALSGITADNSLASAPLLGGPASEMLGKRVRDDDLESSLSSREASPVATAAEPISARALRRAADTRFMLLAFAACCVIFYTAQLFQVYGIGFGG